MTDISKFSYYDNGRTKVIKPTDRMVISSGGLAFEGATNNDFETELAATDPTSDRTITFPDDDGEVALIKNGAITTDDFVGNLNGAVRFEAKNTSGNTINKGQAIYVTGVSGDTKPTVSLARANSSSTMPAFGLALTSIDDNATGEIVTFGNLAGVPTGDFGLTDTLYISADTGGALTNTPPTGSGNLIQNIGKVIRVHASNGTIKVGGAGRTNATPNLDQGYFFIGDVNDQSSASPYTLPISDGSSGQFLSTDGLGVVSFSSLPESIMTELSIPGLDVQTDTNAFRFNCPYGLTVTGLDLYLDQHTTSGNVTITVTNTTDSNSMISLSLSGTNTSATTTTVTNAVCDSGDVITFAITTTPANAQGLRANLHLVRT